LENLLAVAATPARPHARLSFSSDVRSQTAAYHMLRDGTPYMDLGPNHFDKIVKKKTARTLVPWCASLKISGIKWK
jgi:hypothetical protein